MVVKNMTNKFQIGLTCLIVLVILIIIAIKSYLFVGRRSNQAERGLIWKAIKFALPTGIAVMTGIRTICGWFEIDQNAYSNLYSDIYFYFLLCILSIVNTIDNYKEYKRMEEEIRKKDK